MDSLFLAYKSYLHEYPKSVANIYCVYCTLNASLFIFFLIGKKKYIQKSARCKLAPAKQKYKKYGKAKTIKRH